MPAILLSPSEWRILYALHCLGRQASLKEVCEGLPASLPALRDGTVEALLRRLEQRGVIGAVAGKWGPLAIRYEELVEYQVGEFLDCYARDERALTVVRQAVARR